MITGIEGQVKPPFAYLFFFFWIGFKNKHPLQAAAEIANADLTQHMLLNNTNAPRVLQAKPRDTMGNPGSSNGQGVEKDRGKGQGNEEGNPETTRRPKKVNLFSI